MTAAERYGEEGILKAFDEALNSTSNREKKRRQVIDDIDRTYNP